MVAIEQSQGLTVQALEQPTKADVSLPIRTLKDWWGMGSGGKAGACLLCVSWPDIGLGLHPSSQSPLLLLEI